MFENISREILLEKQFQAELLPKPLELKADTWVELTLEGETLKAYILKADGQNVQAMVLGSEGVRDISYSSIKSTTTIRAVDSNWMLLDEKSTSEGTYKLWMDSVLTKQGEGEDAGEHLHPVVITEGEEKPELLPMGNDEYGWLTEEEAKFDSQVAWDAAGWQLTEGGRYEVIKNRISENREGLEASISAAPPKAPAEPSSRGKAPQEEDLTEEAKQNIETKTTPPTKVERMKSGPKSITKDVATATPEANDAQKKAVEAVLSYEAEVTSLEQSIAKITAQYKESLGSKRTGLAAALETLYSLVDKEKNKAIKYKTDIVAVDSKREVKEANLTEGAQKKALEIIEKLQAKQADIRALNEELQELTQEQFRKHGGTETEVQRVTTFPNPSLKSAMVEFMSILGAKNTPEIRAGILDMLKSVVSKFKSLFSDNSLDQDIAEYSQLAAA